MSSFVDTFALIAWVNVRDSSHARVKAYFQSCPEPLVTTEWVLLELADALCRPQQRGIAARFLEKIRTDPQFEVIGYDWPVYQAGLALYVSRSDKDWPLTDCTSFAVMTARGLHDALTEDHHFEQAGFRAVFA